MVGTLAACALVVQLVQPVPSPVERKIDVPSAALTQPTRTAVEPLRRSAALTSLYVSFATLQALDAHSTISAMGAGGREANPAMRGVAASPAALIAVKAATGATTIWLTEKFRKQHPAAALAVMIAVNSTMAAVVAHNYAVR